MAKKPAKPKTKPPGAPRGPVHDLDILRELVGLLDSSSATSIELGRGDASYKVSRMPAGFVAAAPPSAMAPQAPSASPAAVAAAPAAPVAPPPTNLVEIKSPMVGTYYRSPEPGAEPYLKVGTRVSPGQTLCIIEAMKIMNELESEVTGTIREILVEDSQPVEFGQVLFRVEP